MASPAVVTPEAQPGPKDSGPGPGATKANQRHILDIVFLQDSTGSQGTYIQACKAAITDICKKVSEHMGSPASASSEDPIRFGLIAFRDHPPQDTSYVTKNFGFTSEVREMTKWLGGLVASGGGDGPEASTAAMAEALNLDWRQSEDDEEGKGGVKVVKIVVLVTDAPPHGLGESGDGFPKGSPDQNDPLEIARQMAEHGISLYVIACEPTLSYYKHAVDFYRALTEITSGRMVPLLNASQLGDYIIGSALETLATEELIAQFQDTILEDVYGQGKSVEEVVERVQQQLAEQQVKMKTLQVDDVYAPSKEAESNVFSWKNAGKLGDARGRVQEISAPRMKAEYAAAPGMGSFGTAAMAGGRMYASTPCGAMPSIVPAPTGSTSYPSREVAATGSAFSFGSSLSASLPPLPLPPPPPPPLARSYGPAPPRGAAHRVSESFNSDEDDAELEEDLPHYTAKARGKVSMTQGKFSRRESDRSYPPASAYGAPAAAPTYGIASSAFSIERGGGGGNKLPQVQTVEQAVSMDQTRRLVMQGLSRHAKVGPGGKLTPKGVWAKPEGGVSEKAVDVDGPTAK